MPARYETIAGWVNEIGWTKGAELGVSDGKTHAFLLENCPALHLIGVDVWDLPVTAGSTFSGERCGCAYCSETRAGRRNTTVQQRERMARNAAATFGRSKLYKMTTEQAAAKVDNGSLDFVFVDGDHAQEGVSADIRNWLPKIRPGGRMMGHDWNMQSVRDAVHEHFAPETVQQGDDHLWWVDRG